MEPGKGAASSPTNAIPTTPYATYPARRGGAIALAPFPAGRPERRPHRLCSARCCGMV